jgi:hypothetical protein
MGYLKTFLPWIAYGVGSAAADWRVGLCAGLAVAVVVLVTTAQEIDLISWATVAFMALLLPVAIASPHGALSDAMPAACLAFLGVVAGASILVGRPFTETYARRETPPELWATDLFRQANRVITAGWTVSFLATAFVVAVLLVAVPDQVALRYGAQAVGFLAAARFTRWYRGRLAALLAPVPVDPSAATA